MENQEVDPLGTTLKRAFERAPGLQPRPEFIAGLTTLRPLPTAVSRTPRFRATRWLTIAATFLLVGIGGYWSFEARLSADPLREAAIGDHRYCALGLTTNGKEATGITSLAEAVSRYEPGFRVLEDEPGDEIPTSDGPARVLNRHSCVFGGRRFAHIILDYRHTSVSLIVTRGAATRWSIHRIAAHEMTTARWNDLTVMSIRTAGYAVFVVGGLPASELSPLAGALSADLRRVLPKE
ncbi:MAG TPA: hypothetical protein VL262_12030 [Vicinamibacterales bacterium]|jgi:hypothetical protein|nr:hypothetical protein [Vicinamibacterales bacterium]